MVTGDGKSGGAAVQASSLGDNNRTYAGVVASPCLGNCVLKFDRSHLFLKIKLAIN
jgi:hypothetical protein